MGRMSFLSEINRTFKSSEKKALAILGKDAKIPKLTQEVRGNGLISGDPCLNRLYDGDNIDILRAWIQDDEIRGKISLFYMDPPFFSMADYDAVLSAGGKKIKSKAYKDSWDEGMKEYVKMLYPRIYLMRELLADDGLIFVHVDWHASHMVRLMLDDIFGPDKFVNEIIWQYKSGGSSKKHFARKHDNILVYSKTNDYRIFVGKEKSYNRDLKPYRFKGVEEFKDEIGWHTLVNMKDVWEIDMVGRTSGERTGYATQKPEELMKRIIEAGSSEGDLVADPFCGSGSFGVAASKLGRRFLMADSGRIAIETSMVRMVKEGISFICYEGGRRGTGAFDAELSVERLGQGSLRIEIRDINYKNPWRIFKGADLELVNEKLNNNPLELISSWSIGYEEGDGIHRPSEIFVGERGKLEMTKEVALAAGETISIRITDIFGNSCYLKWDGGICQKI